MNGARRIVPILLVCGIALAAMASGYPFGHSTHETGQETAFVGSRRCAGCHADEFAAWDGSGHARFVQAATDAAVLGDFDAGRIGSSGKEAIDVLRDESGRRVRYTAPDGRAAEYRVEATLGGTRFQGYLGRDENGGWRALPLLWEIARARWIPLSLDPLTGRAWTESRYAPDCARCHVVGLGAMPEDGDWRVPEDARIFEFGVGCEACHGPGADHAAFRLAEAKGDAEGEDPYSSPASWSPKARGDLCASCHGPKVRAPRDWTPGEELPAAAYAEQPVPLLGTRTFHYWPDGTEEVPFASLGVPSASRPYHLRPDRCGDCHDPHGTGFPSGLRAAPDDDALCAGCHGAIAADPEAHTRHPAGSTGSRCVECHMPRTAAPYSGVSAAHELRAHGTPIPNPEATIRFGAPNACNLCHGDRSPRWAAAVLEAWAADRGTPGPSRE